MSPSARAIFDFRVRKGAEFIGNKRTIAFISTKKHSDCANLCQGLLKLFLNVKIET